MKLEVEVRGNLAMISVESDGSTVAQAEAALLLVAGFARLDGFEIDDPPCEISGLGCYAASMTLRDHLERNAEAARGVLAGVIYRVRGLVGDIGPEEMARDYIAARGGYFGG